MKYSYEFKLECVNLYRETGTYPPAPDGCKKETFKYKVRYWSHLAEIHGIDILKHSNQNKEWSPEEKLRYIMKYKSGCSLTSTALEAGIAEGQLLNWIRKYDELGYNGLVQSKKGRPSKNPNMKKKANTRPQELTESEREELIRLREENEFLKAQSEALKKEQALRYKRWDEQLKAKKQRSSKNSEKKDTN